MTGAECIFRDAGPDDEAVLLDMLYFALFVPPAMPPLPKTIVAEPAIARYVRGWGRHGDDGTIAMTPDGGAIGAAWLRLWPDDDCGYGFIDVRTPELSVAVRPEFRGRGVGTTLLRRVLRRADAAYESVSLSVSIQNPAVRLYQRFGFVVVAADEAAMVMQRKAARSGA